MTVADKEREGRFDALFRQYLPDMVAYCGWRSGSRADAQDAVAEVFLAAWRRLEEIPDGKEARLWLYGTARRVVANQARADRRRARLSARMAGNRCFSPRLKSRSSQSSMCSAAKIGRPATWAISETLNVA